MVKSTQANGICGLTQRANEGACLIAIKLFLHYLRVGVAAFMA
jgi:hypothetical protein